MKTDTGEGTGSIKHAKVTCAARRYEYMTVEVEIESTVEEACTAALEMCDLDPEWDLGERYTGAFVDSIEVEGSEKTVPQAFLEEEGTHPMKEKPMEVQIKVLDARLGGEWPLPRYETEGAAAMDVRACIDAPLTLEAGESAMVSAGFAMHIATPDVAAVLLPRSGLATREGVVLANLVGLVDSDYQGAVTIAVWNRGSKQVTIAPGTRLAQIAWIPVKRVSLTQVGEFEASARGEGGFGHTGAR